MINHGSAEYTYVGCYEETIALTNTSHLRALHGGMDQVGQGSMTVPICLDFCGGGGNGHRVQYEYAGLEYSRYCPCFAPSPHALSLASVARQSHQG